MAEPEHFGQVNRIIMWNYQILKRLFNETGTPVKNWLLSDEGIEIFMCYEYGWYQMPENKVRIYFVPPLFLTGMADVSRV